MRVIIAGGGTGGHLFPGIAIAEEIKRRDEVAEVYFIGTEHGIEAAIIPKEGYPIKYLRAEGVVGKSPFKKLRGIAKTILSLYDSYTFLERLRPDAVIGVGGYASFGPVFTGHLMSLPTLIAEQNSVPGLANKVLGRIADAVCVTYHESISFFPKSKTFITGNPVRAGILSGSREGAYDLFSLERNKFTIFVFGGSSGARTINNAVCGTFGALHDLKGDIQFLHQTGKKECEAVRETYRKWGFKGTVTAFIHQMAEAYAVADLVISRAGATTLAELTSVGKPAILVPYPYAAGYHQQLNAQRLSEMGAVRVILDHELDGETLAKNIRELYTDVRVRFEMQRSSRSLGRPDAAEKIVDILISLVKQSTVNRRQPVIRMKDDHHLSVGGEGQIKKNV
ncbi:MAG TPA: undecaprenyldiphospho-muramoylpentapeptide beta-N-acetylglucosaminyltransferase [Nitrospiraceae bacterium]|jgi:UDP-N-acetylglucosamine--N-acetylmuramyl-(pentapeptide) pyrophosphoryl-undecaprenol N-acetylglucosamine transferase|nr:undecaprenyldiphospho-muramoylpentapeptide beta-N-acetylglucosaminyltransferase [Nitrospiraceae bacterium]